MKKCNSCNLKFETKRKSCPLCFETLQSLSEDIVQPAYPKLEKEPHKYNVLLRISTFLTILAIFASILINLFTYKQFRSLWSIIVILGVLYFWVLLRSTFRAKNNVPMRLVIQMLMLSILVIGIDSVTGFKRWSLNYVIPFLSMASLLAIISVLIGSLVRFAEYLLYLLAAIILGFIPIILWLVNLIDVLWPSLAAASLSFVTIIGMIVFADKETKEELKKRFHI
ncbi:MAG: DUF6320 domain-containing protein [Bacilli bacterium]|nr:DUF6320 domain-containing protein [Bacilli bacterium]